MHNGMHAIKIGADHKMTNICDYMDHDSMSYGCDWFPSVSNPEIMNVISCSFYDKSVHLWQFNSAHDLL